MNRTVLSRQLKLCYNSNPVPRKWRIKVAILISPAGPPSTEDLIISFQDAFGGNFGVGERPSGRGVPGRVKGIPAQKDRAIQKHLAVQKDLAAHKDLLVNQDLLVHEDLV